MLLLSTVGSPLDEPQVAAVEIIGEANEAVRNHVEHVVNTEFDALGALVADLAHGRLRVY